MTDVAGCDELVFENDEEMETFFADPARSECLSNTLHWSDAVEAASKGEADLIVRNLDNGDKWSAYRLLPRFEGYRAGVREMTRRRHKYTFGRSRA